MMGLLGTPEVKVGLLVISVGALIAGMSMRVSDSPSLGGSKSAWFMTPNASGIIKNSAVRMAGIPVGIIKDIRLEDGQARVDMVIKKDVIVRLSSGVEIKSNGILGDKFVEITPGNTTDGNLKDGAQIFTTKDTGSMDNVMAQVGEVATSLKSVAKNLQEAVEADGTNKHVLGRIVQNIEKLTGNIAEMTDVNKQKINEIIAQVRSVTGNLDEVIGNKDTGLKKNWAKLDKILQNVEDVTNKVNNGEGTIGRLINDEKTVDSINEAIEGVSGFFDSAGKMQTSIDFHSEYLGTGVDGWKSYIGIKLQPGLDRFYLLQIVDDPGGLSERITTTTKSSPGSTVTTDETKSYKNKTKFSLQFAKNFYDFTVRGGLIESTGGFGADYSFYRNQMKLSVDAFNFTQMNVRPSVKYNFYKGLYLVGGVNDALNKSGSNASYIGAGLFLTNDDVKLLMTKLPF